MAKQKMRREKKEKKSKQAPENNRGEHYELSEELTRDNPLKTPSNNQTKKKK